MSPTVCDVPDCKVTVAIPYKARLENLTIALNALCDQSMDRSEFEVVVGAMEYATEYVDACRHFADRLDIVSVMSARDFNIPTARNLAMRHASGRIVVQMDADTLLPPDALRNLYDRYFSFGQNVCIVGQVVGYGNNNDGDVEVVEHVPYEEHRRRLLEMGQPTGDARDARFKVEHRIPWAFVWTGLVALPMETVRRHDLFFDETFWGWGVDDLEWGFRICASGTPIVLREDVHAIHLPHVRDAAANRVTERANFRRFLRKWPRADVELTHAFNDMEANELYPGFVREVRDVSGGPDRSLAVVAGAVGGADVLVVGATVDDQLRVDPEAAACFAGGAINEILPLAGIGIPYDDKTVDECRILPRATAFSGRYWTTITAEADRVAKHVVLPAPG